MKGSHFVAAVLFIVGTCNAIYVMRQDSSRPKNDLDLIMDIIMKPRTPEKYQTGFRLSPTNGFSWSSCGGSSDMVTITDMSVKPDQLVFPGNVTVAMQGKINSDIKAPIKVEVELQKKIALAWVTVPCMGNVGSCSYSDICEMLAQVCPTHMPCTCPIKAGPIDVPPTTQSVETPIPDGDYKANIKATQGEQEVMCLDFQLAIG